MRNLNRRLDPQFVLGAVVALGGVALGISIPRPDLEAAAPAYASPVGLKHAAKVGPAFCTAEVTWDVFDSVAVKLHDWTAADLCTTTPEEMTVDADLDGNGTAELILPSWLNYEDFSKGGVLQTGSAVLASRLLAGRRELQVIHDLSQPASHYEWLQGATSYRVYPVACRDMSGDGAPDLVCVTYGGAGYTLCYFRNKLVQQSASAADINRDGVVNGADLTMLLVAWAQGS